MATTTKKTARKPAKKVARKSSKKGGKKGGPSLKQLVARTQKIQGELAELLAMMRRMSSAGDAVIDTDLESNGGAKIIQPLSPDGS